MSRWTGWVAVGVLCAFVFAVRLACDETLVPEEAELERYPELQPFLAGRVGFTGGTSNLDTGLYSFSFPTECGSATLYFSSVSEAAARDGWRQRVIGPNRHVYVRRSEAYPAADFDDSIELRYDEETATVTLTCTRDYPEDNGAQ